MRILFKIFNWFKSQKENDPVYKCLVYKRHGCPHIDGYLCDMKTCNILEDYKMRETEQQLDIPFKYRMNV